jgi:HAD superfamily hydrolase (TIGR01484 family)
VRPLDELEASARGLRGVFCDIDDTLTHAGALVPEAYAQLAALHEAGLRVVPVTGRPAGWAAVLAATWPVDAVVAENGAVAFRRVVEGGRAGVEPRFWDGDETRASQRTRLDELRRELGARWPWARPAEDQWLRLCDVAFDVGERQSLAAPHIAELRAAILGAGARCLVSTVHAHAFYGDHDKARMAERLARDLWGEDLAAERSRYLFVGDSPNDAAGFAYFPISAGPSNVARYAAELDPPPAFVAPSPGGYGFAEIAAVVLRAQKRS